MTAETNNALKYVLLALAAFAVGSSTALVPQLMDPSMPMLNWRIVFGTGIATMVAAYGGSFLPKAGHAEISELADSAGHAAAKTALSETVAAQIAGVAATPFTAAQVAQLVDALHGPVATDLEARMKAAS